MAMLAALLASAAAFVPAPLPTQQRYAAPADVYAAPAYANAVYQQYPAVYVAAPTPQRRHGWGYHGAVHAALTGAVAASLASLGLMGTLRSPSRGSARRNTPLVRMVETETQEKVSIFDKMRGVVVKTNEPAVEEEQDDSKSTMQKVKDAGTAGIISYIFWEWAFWGISVPVACFGFQAATGHWPNFQDQEDLAKLGAEAFAFVNVARFAIPLRIGLALGTTPWVQANIVDKFQKKEDA